MTIAQVSSRTWLSPLTRRMAMKAPRQDASAARSSERAEADRAAAGGDREEAEFIQKTCYLQPLLHPRAGLSYTKARAMLDPSGLRALRILRFLAAGRLAHCKSGQRASEPRLGDRSREVQIALVLNGLRDGDVLQRDGIVGVSRDHRVAIPLVMR